MSALESLVQDFTAQLTALVEAQAIAQARLAVEATLGGRGPGRPAKFAGLTITGRPRKRAPKQLCPVPGCKNAAAPVFGMVCAQHKDVAKSKIKAYRAARKAKKLGLKPARTASTPKQKKPGKPKKAAEPTKATKAPKVPKRRAKASISGGAAAVPTAPAAAA